MAVAKCNITSFILEKLNQLHFGVKGRFVDDIIIENYLEYIACEDIPLEICNPADCINETINFTCSFAISKISYTIFENTITFYIDSEDISNGLAPYTYEWDYEEDDFDNSSAINLNQAILTVKLGKEIGLLVTNIKVTVIDANGCKVIKNCYLTPNGMQCAENYVPCPNISNLTVINNFVECPSISGLLVYKKL